MHGSILERDENELRRDDSPERSLSLVVVLLWAGREVVISYAVGRRETIS